MLFDDVTDDWLTHTRESATAAALYAARRAAAERLIRGPASGHRLTAEGAVDILMTRDSSDPLYDVLQPYERRWAALVVRALLGISVAESEAVNDARLRGATWAAIGEVLGGLTAQAAQQRFNRRASTK